MNRYIKRLVDCGYTQDHARKVCEDFTRNLPLIALQCFVEMVEENVEQV